MTMQDAPAIRTAGLGKRYGSLWALKDCSVSVPRSRVSALVGPNGAGKTTLLKILAGLIAPSAGEAAVLGRAPGQSAEFLGSVGYLAQDVPLSKRLSAGDHLILLAASRTELVGDIDDVLATHKMLVGPRRRIAEVEPGLTVIKSTQTARQTRLLVRLTGPVLDPSWEVTEVGLEDIVVAYMGLEASSADGQLTEIGAAQ